MRTRLVSSDASLPRSRGPPCHSVAGGRRAHMLWCLLRRTTGQPTWLSGKESTCLSGRHGRLGYDLRVRDIPWRRKWQPTPVFLPGKFHRQRCWRATVHGVTKSQTRPNTHRVPQSQQDWDYAARLLTPFNFTSFKALSLNTFTSGVRPSTYIF